MTLLHLQSEKKTIISRNKSIAYKGKLIQPNHRTLHFSTLVGGKNLGDVKKGDFGSLKSNFGGYIGDEIIVRKLLLVTSIS